MFVALLYKVGVRLGALSHLRESCHSEHLCIDLKILFDVK